MAEYLCEEDMSTGEYISRDVALRQLNATCLATECNNYNGVMCRACAYADAMDFIEAIPAAEVQPVKRGKWEKKKGYLVCSNCGMTVDTIGYTYEEQEEVFRYCSCCGYRMDGDSECQ
jgi:hypothetical protein